MAKGSQLTQLKSALSQAGLNRQPPAGKKRKRALSTTERDNEKKAQKLQEIQQKLNPFDVKVTKVKHDVGGRKLKGVSGKPQESNQAGLEKRKRTLLKEHKMKDRAGGVIDRRFGENDPDMTPEERMLERFTKERQRASRGAAFNLEDDDELTHYGQSLSKLDDFDDAGLTLHDEDEEDDGKIDREVVQRAHFGGFDEDEEEDEDGEPSRKKSKAEVMSEIIEKSKHHKAERQLQKQQDADVRHQLDGQLDDIRQLLFASGSADPVSDKLAKDSQTEDRGYDVHVRELALDKRAKPKDRTKTEEEQALEAKEALEKAERKRQRRMTGEADESSDEEQGVGKRSRKRDKGGDDLEDDFVDEEDIHGLGAGLRGDDIVEEGSDEDEDKGNEIGDGSDGNGDLEESDGGTTGEGDQSSEDGDEEEVSDAASEPPATKQKPVKSSKASKKKELPYTFPCPETHEDFLSIVEDIDVKQVPTVVQRIRTLHHASLAIDNKFKLQALTEVLIDYILHVTAPPEPNFHLLPPLLQHIHVLTSSYPVESAKHFITKLKLMQKNLQKGLSNGSTSGSAKTWPGTSELALLWIISHVWPTSDMDHPVVSPTRLLIGSYLALGRIRNLHDLSSGLFLCTLFLRYEEYSKRLVPEVVNVLLNAILHLAPHRFKTKDTLPGVFPCPDFNAERCRPLKLNKKLATSLNPGSPNLVKSMARTVENVEQAKLDLLAASLDLLGQTSDMYKSLDGFIELFGPVLDVLDGLKLDWASDLLRAKHQKTIEMLRRLLKFANAGRRPLALQAHKPIPIATYIPKFEVSKSSYLGRDDPDHERAAASKLRYQYKQERKGAIRELRKDARFMSAVKQKEQQDKDKSYADKMNKVFSSLESERAEQKKMDREKQKDKKRAGRK